MNLFKVCSIKIESLAYYKADLVFAWFPRLASYLHDFDRYKVSSQDERLSPSIEFEDDIELSQYKLKGQFSKFRDIRGCGRASLHYNAT